MNTSGPNEEDGVYSDEEENVLDKEPHELNAKEETEDSCTENVKVEICKDLNKERPR